MTRTGSVLLILLLAACAPLEPQPEDTDAAKSKRVMTAEAPPELLRAPFSCDIPSQLESIGRTQPIHMRPEANFGSYQHLYFNPLRIEYGRRPASSHGYRAEDFRLSDAEEQQLNKVFREALIEDWLNRFGWTATGDSGERVLNVDAWITDLRLHAPMRDKPQASTFLTQDNAEFLLTVQLSDSVSGEVLLYSCEQRLRARNTPVPGRLDPFSKVSLWQSLERTFTHWASRIGSHIMTAS